MKSISLRLKITFVVFLSVVICAGAALTISLREGHKQVEQGIIAKAETVLSRLDSARKYVATQGGLKPAIDAALQKHKSSDELSDQEKEVILKQVPIVASMMIGSDEAEKENYKFRIFSDEPRRKENLATAEELKILKEFEADPTKQQIVTDDDINLSVFRPIRLSKDQGCLHCHGDPATSPWGNGKDILGHQMENWKDGKLHGVFGVITNIESVRKAQAAKVAISTTTMLFLWIFGGGLVAVLFGFLFASSLSKTFNEVSGSLAQSAQEVSQVANQIAGASQSLSSSTSQQAAALQETTAAIEETSAMISKNADNAKHSYEVAEQARSSAHRGKEAIDEMSRSIQDISQSNAEIMQQIEESNREISAIVRVISEIGNKTKVINEIVFQTKLLSFNASVEAARAGEHGKGFAVVAEEVGNLAQMSGNSAKEISTMLEESSAKVESIVNNTKTRVERLIIVGKEKVSSGAIVARRCSEVLDEIVNQVNQMSGMVSEISTASQEQAKGVSEINKAMSELDSAAQQNNSASAEASVSAEQLKEQVASLHSMVERLNDVVQGDSKQLKAAVGRASKNEGSAEKTNVVYLKDHKKKSPLSQSEVPLKAVANGDSVPDHRDPGFGEE